MMDVFDWLSVLLVFAVLSYVIGLIMISELIRSRRGLPPYFTRRIIHLLAGDPIVVLPLFKHMVYPLIITIVLALMVLIGLSKPDNPFSKTMVVSEYDRLHVYGPLYYIVAIMILVLLFYNHPEIVVASTMIMAWGDGFASLIPRRISRPHMIFDRGVRFRKSVEGTISMLVMGFIGALVGLAISQLLTSYSFNIVRLLPVLVVASTMAAVVELLSIGPLAGFDNLTVPLAAAVVMYVLGYPTV